MGGSRDGIMVRGARRGPNLLLIAVVALVLVGVFILPWYVPPAQKAVVSDSQAAGFNNRVAVTALALGAASLFMLGLKSSRHLGDSAPIRESPVPREHRVNRWIFLGSAAMVLAMVAVIGLALGDHPYSDSLYFTSVLLRMDAGAVPFRDVEFSYGALLLYYPWAMWRMLKGAGLSVYPVYYVCVASFHLLGLSLAAFILNRMTMPKGMRNGAFVFVVLVSLLAPTLGLGYTSVRFLLPYALYLGVMGLLLKSPRAIWSRLAPPLAVALAAAVSPEMGMALFAAFMVGLVVLTLARARDYLPILVVLAVGVALAVSFTVAVNGVGTFGAFASGAYYFPVLPSLIVLSFVLAVLTVSWRFGEVAGNERRDTVALHVGWMLLVVVLIAPAFGRADTGHVVWNGLGAVLSGVAVMSQRPWKGALYLAIYAVAFAVIATPGMVGFHFRVVKAAAIETVVTTEDRAERLAVLVGGTREGGEARWRSLEAERQRRQELAVALAKLPHLAFPNYLSGEVGRELVSSGNLVPLYIAHPGAAVSSLDYGRMISQLDEAEYLAILTSELARYDAAADGARTGDDGIAMSKPAMVGESGPSWNIVFGFPIAFRGRYSVFDPQVSFGSYLKKNWVTCDVVGDYTVMRRR